MRSRICAVCPVADCCIAKRGRVTRSLQEGVPLCGSVPVLSRPDSSHTLDSLNGRGSTARRGPRLSFDVVTYGLVAVALLPERPRARSCPGVAAQLKMQSVLSAREGTSSMHPPCQWSRCARESSCTSRAPGCACTAGRQRACVHQGVAACPSGASEIACAKQQLPMVTVIPRFVAALQRQTVLATASHSGAHGRASSMPWWSTQPNQRHARN